MANPYLDLDKATPEAQPGNPYLNLDEQSSGLLGDVRREAEIGVQDIVSTVGLGLEKAGAEEAGRGLRTFARERSEKLVSQMTPEQQVARQEEIFPEEGGINLNPRRLAGGLARSAPAMAAGMGVGGLLTKGLIMAGARTAVAGAIGGGVGEGAVAGATSYTQVYDGVKQVPPELLARNPEFQKILSETQGETDQERYDVALEKLASSKALTAGGAVGAATAVLGAPSGVALARILGGETGKTAVRTIIKQAGLEAAQEAMQSPAETYIAGHLLGQLDPSKKATTRQLVGSAVEGAILGGVLGGGMGGVALGGTSLQERVQARRLGVSPEQLRVRARELQLMKLENPDFDISSPEAKQFLAGALVLRGGKFAPKESTTVPTEEQEEITTETGVQPDLAPTTPLEPLTAPAVAPEVQAVAAKAVAQPEAPLTEEEAQVVAAAPEAVAAEVQRIQETQDAAQTREVGQDVQQQRLRDVQGPAQEGGVETPGAEAGGRGGVRDTAEGVAPTQESIQEPIQSPTQAVEPAQVSPRESIQEPQLAPAPVDEIPGVAPLKRGYKRTTFALDAPGFQGDTIVEDISTKGKKTFTVVRRNGQIIQPSESLVSTIERHRAAGLERPSEAKFSRDVEDKRWLSDDSYGKPKVAPTIATGEGTYTKDFEGTAPADGVVYAKDYNGEYGNRRHVTRNESVWVPVELLQKLPGVMGEQRAFSARGFGNYSQSDWTKFKKSLWVDGIQNPVFVTKDPGEGFKISEGNHRVAAAIQLGFSHLPVHVRYFGKAETEGTILQEAPKFSRSQDDINLLNRGISRYLGRAVAPDTYKLSAAPRELQETFAILEQILGKRIVFFEAADNAPMRFNGVSRINPGVLYVNAKASKPLESVVGHEFLHELKQTDPELYGMFKDAVLAAIPQRVKDSAVAQLRQARAAEGKAEYDIEAINEELVADFFGDQFLTKEFWAKVERKTPQGFARLVEKFLAFIEKIKVGLKGEQAVVLNKAQDAAADALARYIRKDPDAANELSDPSFAREPGPPNTDLLIAIQKIAADLRGEANVQPEITGAVAGGTPPQGPTDAEKVQAERQRVFKLADDFFASAGYYEEAIAAGEMASDHMAAVAEGLDPELAQKSFNALVFNDLLKDNKVGEQRFRDMLKDMRAKKLKIGTNNEMLQTIGSLYRIWRRGDPVFSRDFGPTIEVDGVQRPTMNSNGQPIHPTEEGIKNFWRWATENDVFQPIVDASGAPAVLYHATRAKEDFRVFDPKAVREDGTSSGVEPAIFVSTSPEGALMHAGGSYADNVRVMPLYARTKGTFDGADPEHQEAFREAFEDRYDFPPDAQTMRGVVDYQWRAIEGVMRPLMDYGFDSFEIHEGAKNYAVLFRDQLKSATGNVGTFDPANPDITFSRYGDNMQENLQGLYQAAKAAKAGVTSTTAALPRILKVMPLSGVVDIYKDVLPQLKRIKATIDEQTAARNQELDTAEINRRDVAKQFRGKKLGLFNAAVEYNSLYQMNPTKEWYDQDWVPKALQGKGSEQARKAAQTAWEESGLAAATGVQDYLTAYRMGREAYDKLADESQRTAYERIVTHYKNLRRREFDANLKKIDEAFLLTPEQRAVMTKEAVEKADQTHAEMVQRVTESYKNLKGNYTSLFRKGDYQIGYISADGVKGFEQLETKYAADLRQAELEAEGATITGRSVKELIEKGMAFIPNDLMSKMRDVAEAKYIDAALQGVDPANQEEVAVARAKGIADAQETIRDMNELFFRWLPETAAMKSHIRRKSTRGYTDDHLLAYMNYVQVHSNNIAYLEYGRKIEDMVDEMAAEIRAKRNEGANVEIEGHILNDIRARLQSFKDAKTGAVAANLGKLTSVWFMSSPSTALVQMSQLGVFTLPYLAVRYGLSNASAELTKALGRVGSPAYNQEAMLQGSAPEFSKLHEVVTSDNKNEGWAQGKKLGDMRYSKEELNRDFKKLPVETLRLLALREAMARNVMNISMAYEATEAARGDNPESLTNKVAYTLMTPMRASELASRKAAILASFELALQEQKRTGQEFDFFGAMDAAVEATRETMFDYSKENKGVMLQGSTASILARFQTFRIMSTFKLLRLGYQAIKSLDAKGDVAAQKELQRVARRELIGVLGMSSVLAGVLGTPFAVFFGLANLANAMFGDDDEPWDAKLEFDKWLRQNYGETAAAGVQRGALAAMGVDVHRRIGLDPFAMGALDAPEGTRGGDYADFVASQLLGPSYSMGRDFMEGWKDVDEGRTVRGMEKMVPKGFRDVLKSYRMATEGLKDRGGKKLISDDKIGPDELVMMAFGFSPDEIAQASTRERRLNQMSAKITGRRSELVRDLMQADGGEEEIEARAAIVRFNQKMRPYAITGADIRDARRKIRRGEMGLDSRRERRIKEQFGL